MFGAQLDSYNPLTNYHSLLRMTRMAGYPNMQYYNPHPYQMAWQSGMRPVNRYPFQYNVGRQLRSYVGQPGMGGLRGRGRQSYAYPGWTGQIPR
jgi:hypothetical protein